MGKLRRLPAKSPIHKHMQRHGRQPLLPTDHMGNLHKVVIYDIGQVISRHTVGLEEHLVVQELGIHHHLATNQVMQGKGFLWHLKAHYIRHAFCYTFFHFFGGKRKGVIELFAVMPIVDKGLPACFIVFALRIQFFGCIKGIVSLTLIQKQLGILGIDCLAFALAIRGMRATLLAHSFVIGDAAPLKGFHDIGFCPLHITHLVSILNTQEEIPTMFFSK